MLGKHELFCYSYIYNGWNQEPKIKLKPEGRKVILEHMHIFIEIYTVGIFFSWLKLNNPSVY